MIRRGISMGRVVKLLLSTETAEKASRETCRFLANLPADSTVAAYMAYGILSTAHKVGGAAVPQELIFYTKDLAERADDQNMTFDMMMLLSDCTFDESSPLHPKDEFELTGQRNVAREKLIAQQISAVDRLRFSAEGLESELLSDHFRKYQQFTHDERLRVEADADLLNAAAGNFYALADAIDNGLFISPNSELVAKVQHDTDKLAAYKRSYVDLRTALLDPDGFRTAKGKAAAMAAYEYTCIIAHSDDYQGLFQLIDDNMFFTSNGCLAAQLLHDRLRLESMGTDLAQLRADLDDNLFLSNEGCTAAEISHDAILLAQRIGYPKQLRRDIETNRFITIDGLESAKLQHDIDVLESLGTNNAKIAEALVLGTLLTPEGIAEARRIIS
jgi:hypothetical protein